MSDLLKSGCLGESLPSCVPPTITLRWGPEAPFGRIKERNKATLFLLHDIVLGRANLKAGRTSVRPAVATRTLALNNLCTRLTAKQEWA